MLNGRLLLGSWFVIGIFAIKSVHCDWWLRWMNDWSYWSQKRNAHSLFAKKILSLRELTSMLHSKVHWQIA